MSLDSIKKKLADLKDLKKNQKKSKRGGTRTGSGRKPGVKSPETIIEENKKKERIFEKQEAKKQLEQRIANRLNILLNSQFNLAEGVACLVHTYYQGKGENRKKHTEIIKDEEIIKQYFDDQLEDETEDGEFYYITTEKPEGKMIDSLIDRLVGKASESIKLFNEKENPLYVSTGYEEMTDEELEKEYDKRFPQSTNRPPQT